jgi:mRNA-degrading endonuclease toxin of MazEF toxin-antitoxin module
MPKARIAVTLEDRLVAKLDRLVDGGQFPNRSQARYPLTLELAAKGLPKRSRVKISPVRTLSVERIGKRLARVAPEELALVVEGLNEIIGPEGCAPWRAILGAR